MKDEIKRLHEMVDQIPDGNVFLDEVDGFVDFQVLKGAAKATGLKKNEQIAIATTFSDEDTEFDWHYHPEKEIIICYSGKFWMGFEDRVVEMQPGDVVIINPDEKHYAYTKENKAELIAITIPASKYFPDVRHTKQ